MTGAAFLLLALMLVAAFVDWIAVDQKRVAVETLAKPLTMVFLIAAVIAFDVDEPTARGWFVAALVLSLAGDLFLLPTRDLFVQGLGAFLLAHLAYIVGLWVMGVQVLPFFVGIAAAAALVAVVGRPILEAAKREEPALATPVTVYMVAISVMAASAWGTANLPAALGASLFVSSDALLAWNKFVEEHSWGRVAVIVTYHLGQLGLALSLL
jgi:uncharacterized membrane protein YhhN